MAGNKQFFLKSLFSADYMEDENTEESRLMDELEEKERIEELAKKYGKHLEYC